MPGHRVAQLGDLAGEVVAQLGHVGREVVALLGHVGREVVAQLDDTLADGVVGGLVLNAHPFEHAPTQGGQSRHPRKEGPDHADRLPPVHDSLLHLTLSESVHQATRLSHIMTIDSVRQVRRRGAVTTQLMTCGFEQSVSGRQRGASIAGWDHLCSTAEPAVLSAILSRFWPTIPFFAAHMARRAPLRDFWRAAAPRPRAPGATRQAA